MSKLIALELSETLRMLLGVALRIGDGGRLQLGARVARCLVVAGRSRLCWRRGDLGHRTAQVQPGITWISRLASISFVVGAFSVR